MEISWTWVNPYDYSHVYAVPRRAGVYEVLVELKNSDRYRREYVGQSEDLRQRASDHLSPNEPNDCLKESVQNYVCAFRYGLAVSEADRLDAEQALYDKYEHRCNTSRPPGSGRRPRPPVEEQ